MRTARATIAARRDIDDRIYALIGVLGLTLGVALRVRLAGTDGARSPVAGVWFAAVLAVVAYTIREPAAPGRPVLRSLAVGLGGAVVLCIPPALRHVGSLFVSTAPDGYLFWASVVTLVAVCEEALLRGSLFTRLQRRHGPVAAIAVTGVAFALLHAPVYGWAVVPLDCTVGVSLGVLRVLGGSATAPMVTHTVADLAGWWLR